ncbi:MAG: thermonuclease family protein [Lutibacter sp.]|uniref:thermonuclease family protein n=1 Tax=Lutibacter sp. TaxID=1925666 RepID=UPI00299D6C3C|nr:thermonuclease family protein [Lutibacter sp.]MDX1828751.1 thermonuclease family protein [Lutibacter sp.]
MIKNFVFLFLLIPNYFPSGLEVLKYPEDFTAKVIGVKDGDTIEVLFNKVPIVIRLEHIDCPERKQPFGKKAKQFVSDYIFGKTVNVISNGKKDRWGRLIAVIKFEGKNINKELVKNGLAMHFKKYSKDNSYNLLEQKAKSDKIGIWSQQNVIAPWIFRKG